MKMRRGVCISGLGMAGMIAVVLLMAGSSAGTSAGSLAGSSAGSSAGSLAGAAGAQQATPASAEVKIDNFSFAPATLTVAVGTTVTWTNRDDIPHTVVSTEEPKAFKSKVLDTDEKFSFTFSKAGTYPYFCSVHPKMTGTVVVK
jgi:plastocyanin